MDRAIKNAPRSKSVVEHKLYAENLIWEGSKASREGEIIRRKINSVMLLKDKNNQEIWFK